MIFFVFALHLFWYLFLYFSLVLKHLDNLISFHCPIKELRIEYLAVLFVIILIPEKDFNSAVTAFNERVLRAQTCSLVKKELAAHRDREQRVSHAPHQTR